MILSDLRTGTQCLKCYFSLFLFSIQLRCELTRAGSVVRISEKFNSIASCPWLAFFYILVCLSLRKENESHVPRDSLISSPNFGLGHANACRSSGFNHRGKQGGQTQALLWLKQRKRALQEHGATVGKCCWLSECQTNVLRIFCPVWFWSSLNSFPYHSRVWSGSYASQAVAQRPAGVLTVTHAR